VSGDNQSAAPGQPVPDPLVVRVTKDGNGFGPHPVTFTVQSGGGKIGSTAGGAGETSNPVTINSAANGTAQLPHWRLGTIAGADRVVASIAQGAPNSVTFTAKRVDVPKPPPPRVRAVWPTNGEIVGVGFTNPVKLRDWSQEPWLDLTFDREMDPNELRVENLAPAARWMRVYALERGATFVARPIGLKYMQRVGTTGFVERFVLATQAGQLQGKVIVIMLKAAAHNIVDVAQQLTLDAEFDGFEDFALAPNKLPSFPWDAAAFDSLWKVEDGFATPVHLVDDMYTAAHMIVTPHIQIPATGTGDGTEDGLFMSWFRVDKLG
jgi:hypothetical protein